MIDVEDNIAESNEVCENYIRRLGMQARALPDQNFKYDLLLQYNRPIFNSMATNSSMFLHVFISTDADGPHSQAVDWYATSSVMVFAGVEKFV